MMYMYVTWEHRDPLVSTAVRELALAGGTAPRQRGVREQDVLLAEVLEGDPCFGSGADAAHRDDDPLAPPVVVHGVALPHCQRLVARGRLPGPRPARVTGLVQGTHELPRDLGQKPRRRVVVRTAEQRALPRVRQVQPLARAGHAHVREAPLLFQLG